MLQYELVTVWIMTECADVFEQDAYGVKSVFVNCMEVMSPRRSIDQLKKFATVQQV